MSVGESVWLGLIGGILAFPHCLGMCGAFTLHLSGTAVGRAGLGRQCLWHAGRIATYTFLGGLAAFAGASLLTAWGNAWVARGLPIALGGVMVLMGVVMLGLVPVIRRGGNDPNAGPGLIGGLMNSLLARPTRGGALALGMLCGLLPCPIVAAFLAVSAAGASVAAGMATMAAMGVGTVWSLAVLGATGHMLRPRLRRWSGLLAGTLVVLLGLATALRGTEVYHHVLGCPAGPTPAASEAPSPSSMPSCCGGH